MKTKILVVDDERAILKVPETLVEELGCEPVPAGPDA